MPKLKQHCAISRKRTGFDFKELHEWMDAPKDKLGYNHRIKRHLYNEAEKETIKRYWDKKKGNGWGQKAVVEWLFHIGLDHLSTAYKESKLIYGEKSFNYLAFGMSETNFIHIDHDAFSEDDLDDYFYGPERPRFIDFIYWVVGLFRRM